jgi:hypothetical protein
MKLFFNQDILLIRVQMKKMGMKTQLVTHSQLLKGLKCEPK